MRARDKFDPRTGRNEVSPADEAAPAPPVKQTVAPWEEAELPAGNGTADNDNTEIQVTIERIEWIEERVGPDGTARRQRRSLRARKTAVRVNVRWLLVGLIAGGAIIYKPELAEPLLKLFKIMIRAG
jgi:hypothetical protein